MGKGHRRRNHTKQDEHEGENDQSKKRLLVDGVDIGWHTEDPLLNHLKQFHEKYACPPDWTKMDVIQGILRQALERKLSQKGFHSRVQYTGSSYEGTKVQKADDDPDFEFDNLFIIKGGDQLKRVVDLDPNVPGFCYLEPRDYNKREHCFEKYLIERPDNRRILSAAKFLSDFHRVLAECITEIRDIGEVDAEKAADLDKDYLIKLRRHGPAIQMDVYLNTTSNAAAGSEVLSEQEQIDAGCKDEVTNGAIGDDSKQCNRIDNKRECGLEEEKGESGIIKEDDSAVNEINRNEDAAEFTGVEANRESSQEENGKENRLKVCLKFILATKSIIGKKELSKLKPLYSVDIVPTLHVPSPDHNTEGEYYVAKPVKEHKDRAEELESAWRRSYSLEAKKKLKCADKDNTCKKTVFRILKAIRNRECGLKKMNTYHLKNALLKELDEEGKDWFANSLAVRFMDVLERLISEYGPDQQMSEYFIKEIDLLEHMPELTRQNIHCRLKRLRNSEKQKMRILEGKKSQKRPRKKQANSKHTQFLATGI